MIALLISAGNLSPPMVKSHRYVAHPSSIHIAGTLYRKAGVKHQPIYH